MQKIRELRQKGLTGALAYASLCISSLLSGQKATRSLNRRLAAESGARIWVPPRRSLRGAGLGDNRGSMVLHARQGS